MRDLVELSDDAVRGRAAVRCRRRAGAPIGCDVSYACEVLFGDRCDAAANDAMRIAKSRKG